MRKSYYKWWIYSYDTDSDKFLATHETDWTSEDLDFFSQSGIFP